MTSAAEPPRIATLDLIRGVAVLGILLMNVVAFAMPEAAYMNPRAFGSTGALDYVAWAIDFVLVDGKMRGLFSFLFGASMLLVIERAEAKGENPARIHFARMGWLFAFGMAHLLLVWWGDILHHYALVGMAAFLFRRLPPHRLVIVALLLLGAETLLMAGSVQAIYAVEAAAHGPHPSAATLAQFRDYAQGFGLSDARYLAHDVASYRGNYAGVFRYRFAEAIGLPDQTLGAIGLETLGYMLLGMAGLRSGMLTGAWPRSAYRRWAALGFGIGVPCYTLMAWYCWRQGFAMEAVALTGIALATPIRPLMIVGWASLVVLLARPGGWLTTRLVAAGRMAFTNYLATSLICSTVFYGYGAGLYGRLSRAELYWVVLAIWVLMLLWSKPWLARFRYGPFEWMWRSLSRFRLQPMRGAALPA